MSDFIREAGLAVMWMFIGFILGTPIEKEDESDD